MLYDTTMNTATAKKRKKKRKLTEKGRRLVRILAAAVLLAGIVLGGMGIDLLIKAQNYIPLSEAEITAAIARGREAETDEKRLAAAETAITLVGKVHYFWGGKSGEVGFDSEWGQMKEVTGEGSPSTGMLKPYGLDCSGFVAWCFVQQGLTLKEAEEKIGLGTWTQWDRTDEIRWKDIRVGDFVFQNEYPTDEGNHVGICIGFDKWGRPMFAHCASGFDNVVVTGAGDVFRYARRPHYYENKGE